MCKKQRHPPIRTVACLTRSCVGKIRRFSQFFLIFRIPVFSLIFPNFFVLCPHFGLANGPPKSRHPRRPWALPWLPLIMLMLMPMQIKPGTRNRVNLWVGDRPGKMEQKIGWISEKIKLNRTDSDGWVAYPKNSLLGYCRFSHPHAYPLCLNVGFSV